jgi:hypothetical protein
VRRHHRPGQRKNGGYYGCLAATKGACENRTLVRRTLAEKVILGAVQEQIADPEHITYVLRRVEEEIAKLRSDLPDTLKLKEAELTAEQRRLANFVEFIGEGRDSQALAKALVETERRVDQLADAQPPRPNPARARHPRHRPPLLPRRHDPRRPGPHRRTAPRWCGGRFEFFAKVETAGIEPASAAARKMASTSVAGTLFSPSTRHAGRVVGSQLRRCPRRGWSGPHRVSLLFDPIHCRRRAVAGPALAVS